MSNSSYAITDDNRKINAAYLAVCCVAVFATFIFHEMAHWSMGELLGYDMGLRLNLAFPLREYPLILWKILLVVAAGPLFTLLQGFVVYLIMRKGSSDLFFPFLFTAFYMRILAAVISFKNLNDEASISKETGIGAATLPLIVCMVLFFFVYHICRQRMYSVCFLIANFIIVLILSSILILVDMYLKVRLI